MMRHCLGEHRLECDEFAMGNRAASFGCRFWILCARLCPRAAGKRNSTVGIRWGRCGEQFAQVCRQNLRHNSHQCTCRLILGARTPDFCAASVLLLCIAVICIGVPIFHAANCLFAYVVPGCSSQYVARLWHPEKGKRVPNKQVHVRGPGCW